ncbi:MAG: enoyl-CoA hydratase/isomerase family protein [Acidimicrobiia bacterium]|nr:enoyl-CoA hydratase/isomerase family protein [Acidimicrobiia bacterium]
MWTRARSRAAEGGAPVTYSTVEVRRDGPVGWIVFDRPDVGNAIDAVMFTELEQAWADLDADDGVRVIVNTGNGDAFQTGLDVRQLAQDKAALREQSRRTRDFDLRMTAWHCGVWKPVVCAVNGVCAGAGLHFVADADVVIASSNATFLDPHVSVGQVSAIETIGMIRRSPMEPISRMALMGRSERMTAERARQLGIVSEVVSPDQLFDRAQELAETIAQHSSEHLAATKKALWAVIEG